MKKILKNKNLWFLLGIFLVTFNVIWLHELEVSYDSGKSWLAWTLIWVGVRIYAQYFVIEDRRERK